MVRFLLRSSAFAPSRRFPSHLLLSKKPFLTPMGLRQLQWRGIG
jgi:hypothetical protein